MLICAIKSSFITVFTIQENSIPKIETDTCLKIEFITKLICKEITFEISKKSIEHKMVSQILTESYFKFDKIVRTLKNPCS
jgi:hypothetical protein